jgi:hypothetical protein
MVCTQEATQQPGMFDDAALITLLRASDFNALCIPYAALRAASAHICGVSKRETARVETHLQQCADGRRLATELVTINARFRTAA